MGRRAGAPTISLRPGKTVYTCRFTAHGTRYVDVSTGETDHGRALDAAVRLQAEALLRRPVSRQRRVRHADQGSLAELSAAYLEQVEASGRAHSYVTKQAMHFRAHFLPRWERVSDLTAAVLDAYPAERAQEKTQRKRRPSTVTVYKEQVTLSCFLEWCVRSGHLDALPLFERVRPVSDHKPPDLTREEVRRVLAQLPDRKTHPKRYAVRERYTVQWAQGMRDGEVATLRWSDVDLHRSRLTIRQSNDKARQGRVLELADDARKTLTEMAKRAYLSAALVFGHADLRASLNAACKRAGVERFSTHGFRHARLSELASSTHDVAAIQFAAGHKHSATTDRYVRSRTERTRAMYDAADSGVRNGVSVKKRPKRKAAAKR